MKIETDNLLAAFPKLAQNPFSVALFALVVPMVIIYCSTLYVSAPTESVAVFGALSMTSLAYSAWIFSAVNKTLLAAYNSKTSIAKKKKKKKKTAT